MRFVLGGPLTPAPGKDHHTAGHGWVAVLVMVFVVLIIAVVVGRFSRR